MKDYFGNEIKIGNYVCYPRKVGRSKVDYIIVKVRKINNTTVTGATHDRWSNRLDITVIRNPDKAVVISKKLALQKEPSFKKDMNDPCCNCKYLGQSRMTATEPPECDFCGAPDYVCWDLSK